ncbi:MAG: SDR family oxidoreductase [Vicinamibacterales bacterium]|nr:SDR family oxidoreductase [Vicinamibacterales bacterium]
MTTLAGQVAIVTGGSRGIGRAIAAAFLGEGIHVAVTGVNPNHLAEAERVLSSHAAGGASVSTFAADVRDHLAVESVFDEMVRRLGGVDILINNAGVGWFGSVESQAHDDWRRVMDTNVTGVFNCCKAAIPHLRRRGGGWIINISSLAGSNPFVGGAGYCASKAALDVFSEALMQEVRQDGIRVSYVKPGSVNTDFVGHADPANEWKLRAEDVAQVVVDLVAHDQRSLPSRVEIRPSKPPRK